MAKSRDQQDKTRQEALRSLSDLQRETDLLGRSGLRGKARHIVDHFTAAEARSEHDPIELWGRRIGRGLGAIGVVGLVIYLYAAYIP